MQIEIDFDVFKALTAERIDESDSYNDVLRRLLGLPIAETREKTLARLSEKYLTEGLPHENLHGGLAALEDLGGAWFNGVHFPDGTRFRAIYKGVPYIAEIKDGTWLDMQGNVRTSPSDAASAISKTNVNGWRFWHALRPGDTEWQRLDKLRP